MCGIAGFFDTSLTTEEAKHFAHAMNEKLLHRGPDGGDVFIDMPLALCHRRLSIIDLSIVANQPFSFQNLVIVFNGEIYNYIEIKKILLNLGYVFRSQSDTEVICAAYLEWGEDCVKKFMGMWAFAIWDKQTSKLFCSRDPFGIKPFYYLVKNHCLYFASEIKALKLSPAFNSTLNLEQVSKGLQLGYTGFLEETYYQDIKSLEAGHNLTYQNSNLLLSKYWDILPQKTFEGDIMEAAEIFKTKFENSVNLHCRSDVELGACLSGGLDSSSIVSVIAKKKLYKNLKTFTIYYDGKDDVNESGFVRELQKKYHDIDARFLAPNEDDIADGFHRFLYHQDVPIGGSSPISQYFLMQMAHKAGVKVVLDGQGSDEYLAGYKHTLYRFIGDNIFNVGKVAKEIIAYHQYNSSGIAETLKTLGLGIYSKMADENKLINAEYHNKYPLLYDNADWINVKSDFKNRLDNALYAQLKYSSLPSLLHFEDRNSMAFSIESRVPFLDPDLVNFAFSLPDSFKLDKGITKKILRLALKDYLPEKIYNRTDKKGFVTPGEVKWLKGPLKFLMDLPLKLPAEINSKKSAEMINNYQKGDLSQAKMVWRILVLNYWLKHFAA